MTIEEIVSAIRLLPVPARLRVIELAAHDVASEVSAEVAPPGPGPAVTLIERHGFLVAHAEPTTAVSEEMFDHRLDRDERADRLWAGS